MAKRATNFTENETQLLLYFVEKNKNVLECKALDVNTNFLKQKCWEKIEQQFNAFSNGEHRTAQVLRKKWENVKKKAKRKAAEEKQGYKSTGGGPPAPSVKFTDDERKVVEILGEERVSGSKFPFDCDSEAFYTELVVEEEDEYTTDEPEPISNAANAGIDEPLNVATSGKSDVPSKWKSMSAESLRQPISKCLKQPYDSSSITKESISPFTRKRKQLQDKIETWIKQKSLVVEDSAALKNVKIEGERKLYILKEEKLKQEMTFSAERHTLEMEILQLQKQKLLKELGILPT